MNKVYILKDFEKAHHEGPGDKILVVREATLSGSAASIDVLDVFKEGASVGYFMVKKATVATHAISVAAAVPGATDNVVVGIIGSVEDLA